MCTAQCRQDWKYGHHPSSQYVCQAHLYILTLWAATWWLMLGSEVGLLTVHLLTVHLQAEQTFTDRHSLCNEGKDIKVSRNSGVPSDSSHWVQLEGCCRAEQAPPARRSLQKPAGAG